MTQNVRTVLASLRDIAGVQGSFVLGRSGTLLGKDLPAVFDDGLFAVVGPRIGRLQDALQDEDGELGTFVLRFGEHKLHLRPAPFGILCVLSDVLINGSALKMALSLVARRLEPELSEPVLPLRTSMRAGATDEQRTTLPSLDVADLERAAAPSSSPAPSARRPITYRGRQVS